MTEPLLRFENAFLGYGGKPVLSGVNLEAARGDFLGMFGDNGSGKTTLLRTLLGLIPCLGGKLLLSGDASRPPRFGYVPQKERLDPLYPLSGLDVALMGTYRSFSPFVQPRGGSGTALAERCLADCGAADFAAERFSELSGGQKQRVLIARALAAQPDALVLDEPLAGIDVTTRSAIIALLRTLRKERALTVLMVSHRLHAEKDLYSHIAWVGSGRLETGPAGEMLAGRLGEIFRSEL